MAHRQTAADRFGRFLEAHGLSASGAADLLRVSHVSVLNWLDGEVPSEPFRKAIETLTEKWPEGPIVADEWGQTDREKAIAERLAAVTPLPPPSTPKAA